MHGKRMIMAMLVCFAILTGVFGSAPQPAKAATCFGTGCNGQDPAATGCLDSSAYVISSAIGAYNVNVQLWYSPNCHTKWSRAFRTNNGSFAWLVIPYLSEFYNTTKTNGALQSYLQYTDSKMIGAYITTPVTACNDLYYYDGISNIRKLETLCAPRA